MEGHHRFVALVDRRPRQCRHCDQLSRPGRLCPSPSARFSARSRSPIRSRRCSDSRFSSPTASCTSAAAACWTSRRHATRVSHHHDFSGRSPARAHGFAGGVTSLRRRAACSSESAKAAASQPPRGSSPSGFPRKIARPQWASSMPAPALGGVVAPPLIAAIVLYCRLALGVLRVRRRRARSGRSGGCARITRLTRHPRPVGRRADAHRRAPSDAGGDAAGRRPWLSLLDAPRGLGPRRREVPHRRRVVLLSVLAAEVSLRRPRLRREAGRLLRVDSVRRRRCRQPDRRLVFELAADARDDRSNAARKIALGASAAVMPLDHLRHARARSSWAIVLFSIAFFGQQSWSTLVMIVPTDLFHAAHRRLGRRPRRLRRRDGRDRLEPRLLDACSTLGMGYGTVFSIMGMCHVTAFVLILLTVRRIERLSGFSRTHVGSVRL